MSYAVGSLVRARGREWVVLPESDERLWCCGRSAAPTTRSPASPGSKQVEPATFAPPDPDRGRRRRSARLLRDALRLGFRSSAGPFRSFGRIAVEPRPYQLVPLLMALKLDPVRLLIADDVGIGKTIEAALIARELLDRGEAQRLAVLCPPHLAEQWQRELRDKFHLDAELVLAGTARRLERGLRFGESLFERNPLRHRLHGLHQVRPPTPDFLRAARARDRRRGAHLRRPPRAAAAATSATSSLRRSGGRARHLILVTATPHSGKEDAFRRCSASSTRRSPTCRRICASQRRQIANGWRGTSSSAGAATSAPTWTRARRSPTARRSRRPTALADYMRFFDRVLTTPARSSATEGGHAPPARALVVSAGAAAPLGSSPARPRRRCEPRRRAPTPRRRRRPTNSAGAPCSTSRRRGRRSHRRRTRRRRRRR